jgi:hypothetical protein
VDASFGRFQTEEASQIPAGRTTVMGFALGTPPAGFSYYRLRITEIPTAQTEPGREDEQGGIPVRSLFAAQTSATLVYSVMTGVHVGATLKYMRGTLVYGAGAAGLDEPDLLEIGDDLEGGDDEHRFEFDLGVLAVKGPARAGFVVRNVRQAEFNDENPTTPPMRLPRQYRLGGAFDGDELGVPLTVSLDVDLDRYQSATGDRRVVALGAEYWALPKKLALRGGARFNTVGTEEHAVTTGASYALRPGFFVDGHIVFGGNVDEQGWGLAARVSF